MIRLNDVYGKLISGKLIEAPTDFEGVMNYNTDVDRLVADGWKKVIWEQDPIDGKVYESVYTETESNILQSFVEVIQERKLSKLEFVNKFTDDEFKEIIRASKQSPDIELWMMKFNMATYINLDDELTVLGLRGLEAVNLIAPGRSTQILE